MRDDVAYDSSVGYSPPEITNLTTEQRHEILCALGLNELRENASIEASLQAKFAKRFRGEN